MAERDTSRDIAIIGMACRFAGAESPAQLWENLSSGRTSFGPVPENRWDHSAFQTDRFRENDKTYVREAAFIDDIDSFPALWFGIAPRRVEVMDPQHRLALETTRRALEDAGWGRAIGAENVGTFLGVSTSEYRNLVTSRSMALMIAGGQLGEADGAGDALAHAVENVTPISAFSMPGNLLNMAAANIASQWRFNGPAYTVDAACASSLVAVHDAVMHIRAGLCDAAIAGGVYLNLTPEAIIGFSRIGAISQKGACRPFDAEADGFMQGEGCGIVVLKSYDRALADGDRIHAVIRGSGINNDAGSSSGPMAPSLEGQIDALRRAYRDAELDPATVGFVSCHGTATPVGDPVEVGGLREVFGESLDHDVWLGSVKGNIGHTMSAAGVAGLIHAVLAMQNGAIPPQAGFGTPHPALELDGSPFHVPTEPHEWPVNGTPRRAGVSAFGFGGTNCHMVIEEVSAPARETSSELPELVVLTAANPSLLAAHARAVATEVERGGFVLGDVARTLAARRLEPARLAIVTDSAAALVEELRRAADRIEADATEGALGPDTFWGTAKEAPAVAFMFPGQGAQRVGLLADVYARYPQFRAHLDRAATTVSEVIGEPALDLLYPDVADEAADARLMRTEACQPVMAALGLALGQFLGDLGVKPAVTLGHSLGEFVAAGAAGLITAEESLGFVARRGLLMAALDVEDFGAMAAVMADGATVEPHLVDGVQIANRNHPRQTVISGTTKAVEAATRSLESVGAKVTPLRVSHAFHSPVVAPVVDDLAKLAGALSFSEPKVPVVSAISKAPYRASDAADTFVRHTTSEVDFVAALRQAAESGASVFLEVGAGKTLCSFAQGTLGEDVKLARSLGDREANGGRSFLRTLGALAACGVNVDVQPLTSGRVVTLPVTPLETSRHWVIRDKKVPLDLAGASPGGRTKAAPGDTVSNDKTHQPSVSSDLVALFREQNEILRQHAQIMATQTALLNGERPPGLQVAPALQAPQTIDASPVAALAVEASRVAEPSAAPMEAPPGEAVEGGDDHDFEAIVLESVAGVSAFPADALTADQELAADLGFDSLMFVDLGAELTRRIPGLAIPSDAFGQRTTIADIIDFLRGSELDSQASALSSDLAEEAELRRFRVEWTAAPRGLWSGLPFRPAGKLAITTRGPDEQAMKLAATLERRGIDVRLVDIDDSIDLEDASGLIDFSHHNAAWSVETLVTLRQLAAQIWDASKGEPTAFVTVANSVADPATRGGLRGFTKAIGQEWGNVRALSMEADDDVVAHLLAELDGPQRNSEVRILGGERQVPGLIADPEASAMTLGPDDTVVVTGGARGIAAACVRELAASSEAKFVLVGRSDATESAAFLAELGERVEYRQWDVTKPNPQALAGLRPTVVVHAAGVIRDGAVHTKSDEDVRMVAAVKVDGLRNVLAAAGSSVKQVIGFGSWSGRYGNAQQTEYAAANDAMTQMLRETGADVRGVAIDWPIWNGSDMAQSIPQSKRELMRAQGITFLDESEGAAEFVAELGRTTRGEVLFGRVVHAAAGTYEAQFEASLETMPYVADHMLRNAPLVPMAAALDWMTTAARGAGDPLLPLRVRDVQLFRGIELDVPRQIRVIARLTSGAGTAEVYSDGELAYRAKMSFGPVDLARPVMVGDGVTPTLDLEQFYEEHSFHGPRIRGIRGVDGVAPEWVDGQVKTSTPSSLLGRTADGGWTTDPLVIDASMQLVLYHLRSLHGFGAFPTAIDEFAQVRPFVGDRVRCTMALDEMVDGNIVGTIAFEDRDGIAAVMTRLRAKEFDAPTPQPELDIDPKHWQIAEFPELKELEQRLQMADLIGIRNPYFWPHTGPARNIAMIEGRPMINYSSYNYLGFSGHPDVTKAAQDAAQEYGTSVSASRIASGQIPLHQELEDAIASFIGTEAALVFSAGHMTNETCIGHVFGKRDLIIHDSLAHNSILTGAELSGAKRMQFPHSDYEALERILAKIRGSYEKVGIFIEGVYSMDGDIPDLQKFIDLKKRYKCLLYVDEAHSMGVIGPRGAGISDYFGIDPMEVDFWMGTLSKSFASCGGYVTGSQKLITYLKYTAPAFVFSAGISPANAGAALASVQLLSQQPSLPQTLQKRAEFFLRLCKKNGIDTGMSQDSAVVPAIVGNSLDCLKLSQRLADRGVNVQPIVYPAVEDESSRLRFFLSAMHTEEELTQTVDILAEELANVRSGAAAE